MRTTLTLDQDVVEQAKRLVAERGRPFKQVVNEALRLGLERMQRPPEAKPYRYTPHDMGRRPGINLDNIQEVMAQIDGEDAR